MKKAFDAIRSKTFSLKSKMAFAATLLTAVMLSLTGLVFLHFFQHELKATLSRQNFTLVSSLAGEIDRKLRSTRDHLDAMARSAPAEKMAEAEMSRTFLDSQRNSLTLFDNGLLVLSPSLEILASTGEGPFRCHPDCAFEKSVMKAIETKTPQISEPFFSLGANYRPVVTFVAPIFSDDKQIVAVLAGNVDLLNNNFLGELAAVRLGENGYLYLYNQERTLIVHPDRQRILQRDVPVSANRMFDRALEGFEGTGETVTSRGLHALSSFKRLPTTGWILAANFPMVEAYAPIRKARRIFFSVMFVLLAVSASAIWLLMQRLTAPLADVSRQISAYTPGGFVEPIHIQTNDEIGTLAETFNRMLSSLDEKRQALKGQLRFLQILIDVMPNPVFFKGLDGKYLGCNKAFEAFIGVPREALIGKTVFEIAPQNLAQVYFDADAELLSGGGGGTQAYEASVRWSDKTTRQVVFYKATFCDQDGNLAGLVGTMLDITDRKNAEIALKEQMQFSEDLLQNAGVAAFVLDANHRVVVWNRACEKLTGIASGDLLGSDMHWKAFYRWKRPCLADIVIDNRADNPYCFYENITKSPLAKDGLVAELWLDLNGRKRYLILHAAPIYDRKGNLIAVIQTIDDITDHKNAKESLEEKEHYLNFLNNYDRLTHLPNRSLFNDRLQQAVTKAKHSKETVALLLLDLDRFKTINDSLGRAPGDNILCQIAARLKAGVEESSTVAKFGGDEFAIILDEAKDLKSVLSTGHGILKELSEPLFFEGNELYLTASIGISMYPNDGGDAESLVKAAEVAMYRAKEEGRNNCQFYRPEMNIRSKELLFLEGAFRQAVKQNQFILYYQPQIDLASQRVIGAEALVRWRHPTMGMIPPSDFIPLAEETGLIFPLGDWVLREACLHIKQWNTGVTFPVKISVNISARQFGEPDFICKVDKILHETGINPADLEMEITESAIIENVEEAIKTLTKLKKRGIKLAIDDFGTGYSSLSYLQNFPITHLKIDRSFVKGVCSNEQSAKIASSIIALAQAMHLEVIAEGVETEEQMAFLKARGCNVAQGFLFGKPIPSTEFEQTFLSRGPEMKRMQCV